MKAYFVSFEAGRAFHRIEIGDQRGNTCYANFFFNHNSEECKERDLADSLGIWHINSGSNGGMKRGDLMYLTSFSVQILTEYEEQRYFSLSVYGPVFHYGVSKPSALSWTTNLSKIDWSQVLEISPEIPIDTAVDIACGRSDPIASSKYATVRNVQINGVNNIYQIVDKNGRALLQTTEPGKVRPGIDQPPRDLEPGDKVSYRLKFELISAIGASPKLFVNGWDELGVSLFEGMTARDLYMQYDELYLNNMISGLQDYV